MCKRSLSRKTWVYLGVGVLYLVIAVGMTWPLLKYVATHLPGGSQDTLIHYWNGWWVKQALQTHQSPYETGYLYYPQGLSLVYHNFAWFSIVNWLALEPWIGGLAAYNASIFINLALCGLGAFWLALELTGDRRAAFLGGLIYQCWPFRLYQLDHPNLISTQWIPLFLLFLIRTMRRKRWRDAVWAGVFLVLTGYTRWQQLIPAALLGGIYFLSVLPRQFAAWRRWLPPVLLTGLIAVVALTPPFLMLLRQQRTAPADVLREDEEASMQTDVLAYLTPGQRHPIWGHVTAPAYERYYSDRPAERRFAACIGLVTLCLTLWGAWKARLDSLAWGAMAVVLILLALGPTLRFNGQTYPDVPMPYRLAARSYIVRLLRVPDRFNMFLALPVAMLSAWGGADLFSRIQKQAPWRNLLPLCLLSGVVLFEYTAVPLAVRRPHGSEFYRWLAEEPGEFAALNLPISAVASKRYMFAQVTHQHPIVQGKTPRFPQGTFDYIHTHPWLQAARRYGTMPPVHDDTSRQLATLARDGIRYVILHKDITNPLPRVPQWRHYFVVAPRFEDAHILVYTTVPLFGRDFTLTQELGPGIGPIRVIVSTGCTGPGQPLQISVGWGTRTPPGRELDVELALVTPGGAVRHKKVVPLSTAWPTREWPANAVAWAHYFLDVPPSLPAGEYTVRLAVADSLTGDILGPSAAVGQVRVDEKSCDFDLPPDAGGVNALFGNDMRLLGYQLAREGTEVNLTLHWRSERLMDTDYKIFVHIFDPETGLRVAQDDAMPLRWTYPTTYWRLGDVVADEIPFSLEQAPAGRYRVLVGVYDPDTGKRLPVIDQTGQVQPDDQLLLPGEAIEVE